LARHGATRDEGISRRKLWVRSIETRRK
jgi:hypothetical protein